MVKRRLLFSERPDAIRKTELKPCPFCGSNRVYRHYIMGQNRFTVRCFECSKNMEQEGKRSMEIRPITLRVANDFVRDYHRHNQCVVGCKFAVGLFSGEEIVGVAIAGRPISRHLDDGETIEINRVCTKGERNACSMLYGACCRVAKAMGYKRAITYTLESETGISLKSSNFVCRGRCGGKRWTGKRSAASKAVYPAEYKMRWEKILRK